MRIFKRKAFGLFVAMECLMFIGFISCKKESDPVDPVITFTFPAENQSFNVFDTIHVVATVSSTDRLTSLMVGLVNQDLIPVLPTCSVSLATNQVNTWKIDQYIPIDAIQLQNGNYFVWVRAETEATIKSKYQVISIIGAKKKLKQVLILNRSNVNVTSLFGLDSLLQPQHLFDFSQDYLASAIDPLNSMLYIAGKTVGLLTAFNLDSNKIAWQKSGSSTQDRPYFSDIRMEGNLLLVSTTSGTLTAYDASGDIGFYKDFGFIQYPVRNCVAGNNMIVAVEQNNGSLRYLNSYYYPGGGYQYGMQVPFNVVSLHPLSEEIILVAANQVGIGELRYYDYKVPSLSTPCSFNGGSIKGALKGVGENYFIYTQDVVYWYQPSSHTLYDFVISGHEIMDVDYEEISDQIVISTYNKLDFYSFPQATTTGNVMVPDSLRACLLWYNK